MKDSSKYIISVLKKWEQMFPGIILRYGYDEVSEYHIVEVRPEDIHQGSEKYAEAELALWDEFAEKYPEEEILISNPQECNKIANPLYDSASNLYSSFFTEIVIPVETPRECSFNTPNWEYNSYFQLAA